MLPLPVENELGCVGGVQLFPGKVTGLIFSSGDEIPAYESAWHFPKTAQKQKPTWFGYCQKKKINHVHVRVKDSWCLLSDAGSNLSLSGKLKEREDEASGRHGAYCRASCF
ncbi:hypothetical protein NC651_005163 [Populus alba x Populus x berolinensis]|nr:hypothetical protein NC651_005163 [Populus alba x Populus x berolinensis]